MKAKIGVWEKTRENITFPKQWGILNKLVVEYINTENPEFVRIWFDDSINKYAVIYGKRYICLLYTSPSPRDRG